MVQIKVKGVKENYHIIASYDDEDAFFNQLKERLNSCLTLHSGHFEAFFHVPATTDMLRLFRVCKECSTMILGVNPTVSVQKQTRIIEHDLRGGETYQFYEPLILLGNVHKLAYVVSSESIFVLGRVMGNMDLLHADCTLCASYINASVRIGDSIYQNMTCFSPSKVYYQERKLEIKKYKEELQWEKL